MINIEQIKLSPTLTIWKSKFDITFKNKMIDVCREVIENSPNVSTDGYSYYMNTKLNSTGFVDVEIRNELDVVRNLGMNSCIQIFNKEFNEIKTDIWINVVKAINPVQTTYKSNGSLVFHNHVEINSMLKRPSPLYTFVCYIQMPDNLANDDGVLFMEDIDKKIYSILPTEGDIIIMKGDLPHVPNYAPNSTKDRIVLAGNMRMDFSKLKNTLI